MRDLSAATRRRSGRGRPILFAPVGKKYAKNALNRARQKPLRRKLCFRLKYLAQKCKKLAGAQTVLHFCRARQPVRSLESGSLFIFLPPARDRSAYARSLLYALRWKLPGAGNVR